MKNKIIIKKVVKRENGYLYYIDEEGNLCVAKMCRPHKKSRIKKEFMDNAIKYFKKHSQKV